MLQLSKLVIWGSSWGRGGSDLIGHRRSCRRTRAVSCDIRTHTPARASSTNLQLHYVVTENVNTDCLGHGHGY